MIPDSVVGIAYAIFSFLQKKIFSFGGTSFSILSIAIGIVLILLLVYGSRFLERSMVSGLFLSRIDDSRVRKSAAGLIRYAIIVFGIIIISQTIGINLSSLSIVGGAIGVGVGFGLQTIANNLISGIIILFEKPIKIGDRVEIGDIAGDVVHISIRATTILTNDNISYIVPNSQFISGTVVNWSHSDTKIRIRVGVGVAYSSNVATVKGILTDIAGRHPGILAVPSPLITLDEFADNSLNFSLHVWTEEYVHKPQILRSEINQEILEEFAKQNIEIPFQQREIVIKSPSKDISEKG